MGTVLTNINTRILDRWFSAAALAGLPFIAACVAAAALGQGSALDGRRLARWADATRASWSKNHDGLWILLIIALVGAAVAGSVVDALATRLAGLVVSNAPWLRRLAARRMLARRAAARAAATPHSVPRRLLPNRPTVIGDRLRLVEVRVTGQYGVHVALIWPRVWLLLDQDVKHEIQAAWEAYHGAVAHALWAACYLALGFMWWPAALVGVMQLLLAPNRAWQAIAAFSDLVEAAIDTTLNPLAAVLGVELPHGRVTHEIGPLIDDILAKGAAHPAG